MQKNPTPNQIALFSGLVIGAISTGFLLVSNLIGLTNVGFNLVFALFTIISLTAYLVAIFYLKKFIYRKIKLIYKSIHNRKLSSSEKIKDIDANSDIFSEVEKDVEEWSQETDKEIETLKSYEEYRRRFVGDISHELKTPIFNIQGYLDTLLEGAINDKKVRKKFLTRAANNAYRLANIVEDLEAISRIESGRLELEIKEFEIKKLVLEVFEDSEFMSKELNINLDFKEGADYNYKVRGDKESIRHVLMNLVTNSIKYGTKDGYTKVGFYEMDKNILIEVSDNGIGIDEKHIPRLFERFYRVDKSRSREQGGSGLGLAIVKHIIEAHKQTINVRSEVGIGSTFGFTLERG